MYIEIEIIPFPTVRDYVDPVDHWGGNSNVGSCLEAGFLAIGNRKAKEVLAPEILVGDVGERAVRVDGDGTVSGLVGELCGENLGTLIPAAIKRTMLARRVIVGVGPAKEAALGDTGGAPYVQCAARGDCKS